MLGRIPAIHLSQQNKEKMKTQILTMLFIWVGALFTPTQKYTVNKAPSSLQILGTSSVHDWEMNAENFTGTASISEDNDLTIEQLGFSMKVEDLKSEHSSMDDNTYEALKSDKFPNIKYEMLKTLSTKKEGANYTIQTSGKLTIAGTTKDVNITVKAIKTGTAVQFSGQYTLNMTDYGVDPPTAVWGTIKTGNEIIVKFNVEYKI